MKISLLRRNNPGNRPWRLEDSVLDSVSCFILEAADMIFIADDHSRVVLHDYGPEFDYINASYISVCFCFLFLYYFH